jgi:hypothetical protein
VNTKQIEGDIENDPEFEDTEIHRIPQEEKKNQQETD